MEPTGLNSNQLDLEVRPLLDQSASLFPSKRKAAVEKLLSGKPEYFESLLRLFNTERKVKSKKSTRVHYSIDLLLMSAACWAAFHFDGTKTILSIIGTTLIFYSMLCMIIRVIIRFILLDFEKHHTLAKALSMYDDIRIIGPMAEAFHFDNHKLSRQWKQSEYQYAQVLVKLLPRITSENDIELTSHQVDCPNRALSDNYADLSIAILNALPYIGNNDSLRAVNKLFRRVILGQRRDVLSAVTACIPVLEAR